MKKMKKFFSLLIILCIFIIHPSNSKNLPPGSGQSVPANVLILLDRSFSMNNASEAYGDGSVSMKEPMAATYDPDNDWYWVAETANGGITAWNTSIDPTINKYGTVGNGTIPYKRITRANGGRGCKTGGTFGEHDNPQPIKERKRNGHDAINVEWFNGFVYSAHFRWGEDIANNDFGYIRAFNPRIAHRVSTVGRGNNPFNITNGTKWEKDRTCVHMFDKINMHSDHIAIDIQDGIFYAMSGGYNGVGNAYLEIRDLNQNKRLAGGNTSKPCSLSRRIDGRGDIHTAAKFVTAITADSKNEYLYVANEFTKKIYSFKINSSNNCVDYTATAIFENPCGVSYGLVTDPDDENIMYATGTYTHKICKIRLNGGNFYSNIGDPVGIADSYKVSDADNLYLMEPQTIKFDGNKNLIVANRGRLEVVVLNKNLEFIKVFGLSGVSRLRGAVEAIRSVVSDPALTEGAQFGFGVWSGTDSLTGYNGWNAGGRGGEGESNICDIKNCMPVKVDSDGAVKIQRYLERPITLFRQTHATAFSRMAKDYFNHSDSPKLNLSCQVNYVIVIGDGEWSYHDEAKSDMTDLRNSGVKSIMVAYGTGITTRGLDNFNDMTSIGGSPYTNAIIATTAQDLKTQLQVLVATITSENLGYTAVAFAGSLDDGKKMYQAQFDYFATQEWEGTLKKLPVPIPADGSYDWLAEENLPAPDNRKIWTSLAGIDNNLKNFNESNADLINTKLFRLTGNDVKDYHNDSADTDGTGRCGDLGNNVNSVQNGNLDDAKGLINFIRGKDYFDYNGNCNLTETRDHYLADIYNSQMITVGSPDGTDSYLNQNQEAYFRYVHDYKTFKSDNSNRREVIYVGANNGILHAFNSDDGVEIWGFVPPLVAPHLPSMVNPGLNKAGKGGSVPIFGVDGSPVAHDVFMKKPNSQNRSWQSILMVPYGRGGSGFSVLDVTNPDSPTHLYSILNDRTSGKVIRSDHNGNIEEYGYTSDVFDLNKFDEISTVINNYSSNSSVSSACNAIGNTSCFSGTSMKLQNVSYDLSSEVKVYVDGEDVTTSTSYTLLNDGSFQLTFGSTISYDANPNTTNVNSTVNVTIVNPIVSSGSDYDYRNLASTWSTPRILLLPNNGAGDVDIDDDIYVAVFGGGYSAIPGLGSNLFVMNLENGKIIKEIKIDDLSGNNIANSVAATPVVLTPDLVMNANYRGALVYVNDLEGKITKINLTNMIDDRSQTNAVQSISMYDTNTIFSAESTSENGRYMFHSMEAGIGADTNNLWLFAGTGNYKNLNDVGLSTDKTKIDNLLIGIKDEYFPNYKNNFATLSSNTNTITAPTIDDLDQCKNTSTDTTGANCPTSSDRGWYVQIDSIDGAPGSGARPQRKVSAEPTISAGNVYFPIFKPAASDPCGIGLAYVCAIDDECGTNNSSELGPNPTAHSTERCLYVGKGVLSKPIIESGTIYVAIAGESAIGNTEDLVVLPAIGYNSNTFRINWREN